MEITKKNIDGISLLSIHEYADERGFVMRIYDECEFQNAGLPIHWAETTQQHWNKKNILRGLYIQTPPHSEGKLLRVTHGELLWVSVDLRKGSKTFGQWDSTVLSEKQKNVLYIPRGFAGGVSLADDTDLILQTDNYYAEEKGIGILWNDPELNIDWQLNGTAPFVSEGYKKYPSFAEFKKKYPDGL